MHRDAGGCGRAGRRQVGVVLLGQLRRLILGQARLRQRGRNLRPRAGEARGDDGGHRHGRQRLVARPVPHGVEAREGAAGAQQVESGLGRELGPEGLEAYRQFKSIYLPE